MISPVNIIETVVLPAALGVRFADAVTRKSIGEGLIVEAYSTFNPDSRELAFVTPSNVYVLNKLAQARALPGSPPDLRYYIEVRDEAGRFLPFRFAVEPPVSGLLRLQDHLSASPPFARTEVPLFSSPARSAPAAMAVIRASLVDRSGNLTAEQPAAWAMLEAHLDGRPLARGLADEQGRVVLIFAYPEMTAFDGISPPAMGVGSPPARGPALKDQQWTIELRAYYAPLAPAPPLPDLDAVLLQPPAALWAEFEQAALTEVTLRYGQELIVRSRERVNASQFRDVSVLYLTPASPP